MDKRKEYTLLSEVFIISQDKINEFAEVSGGMGSIHTDPEYAKLSFYKKTLVHGLYVLALIEKDFNLKMNKALRSACINLTYVRPIFAEQPFYFKYIEERTGVWKVTAWSNDEEMIVGSIAV